MTAWYDPTKLAAAQRAQGAGTDGRTVLSGAGLLSILQQQKGLKLFSPEYHGNGRLIGGGDSSDPTPDNSVRAAVYKDASGNTYRETAPGQVQYFDNNGSGFQNPTGNGGDRVQPIYSLDANGTATPISATNNYEPSAWVDKGRDLAKWAAVMGTAGIGGAALAGAGGAPAGAAAGAAGAGADSGIGAALEAAGSVGSTGGAAVSAESAAAAAQAAAVAQGGSGLLGGAAAAPSVAGSAPAYMGPGTAGAGAAGEGAPGLLGSVSNAWSGLPQTAQSMLTKGATGALSAAATGGNPVTGGISGAIGAGVGGLLDNPGIGQIAGGLVGAAIGSQTGSGGALSGLNSATTTAQNTIDPRLSQYLYGAGGNTGLMAQVAALQAQQSQNGGLNANQMQGIDMQKAALMSPGYTHGLDQMRNAGSGLLGGSMAGNPFTSGQQPPMPPAQGQPYQPMQQPPVAQPPGWKPMPTQLNQQPPQMTGLLGNVRPYGN